MPKGASGKGISQAVRNAVPAWMDQDVRQIIAGEARKQGISVYDFQLTDTENWARIKRYSYSRGQIRTFRNNAVPAKLELVLEVRTNDQDNTVEYFTVKVGKKFVTGGDCRIASVYSSSGEKNIARIGENKTPRPVFKRFTEEEINKMNTVVEYGDGFDRLFEDRS